jgi:hypothetical protein
MSDGPDAAHQVPEGVDAATVDALGMLSKALETVERVRGGSRKPRGQSSRTDVG